MDKAEKIRNINPNAARPKNGHFMGLPFTEAESEIVLLSAPWGGNASCSSPANILEASYQLSLYDPDVPEAWKRAPYLRLPGEQLLERGKQLQEKIVSITLFAGSQEKPSDDSYIRATLEEINKEVAALNHWLRQEAQALMDQKKRVGLIGGDSSTQLGLLEALAGKYNEFGVLHLGARMGLSPASPGLACTPENLFTQALKSGHITQLALAGIRSASPEEEKTANGRENISVFYQHEIRRRLYRGHTFSQVCGDIIRSLPDQVYISFDIDALAPHHWPRPGRYLPAGFDLDEAFYLIKRMLDAELEIIGFGLCGTSAEGQAEALLAYRLANLMGHS